MKLWYWNTAILNYDSVEAGNSIDLRLQYNKTQQPQSEDGIIENGTPVINEAFNKFNCNVPYTGNNNNNNAAGDNNMANEVSVAIIKYYMLDEKHITEKRDSLTSQELNAHIKNKLIINGHFILDKDSVAIKPSEFVDTVAELPYPEFNRCMEDLFGFMFNQLLLVEGNVANETTGAVTTVKIYKSLDDVTTALQDAMETLTNVGDSDRIIALFKARIKNKDDETAVNQNTAPIFKNQYLGDDEKSTVVNFATNSKRLREALSKDSLQAEILDALVNLKIEQGLDNEQCKMYFSNESSTLKLNFFSCNIVYKAEPNETETGTGNSLEMLIDQINASLTDNEMTGVKKLEIILNGNSRILDSVTNDKTESILKTEITNLFSFGKPDVGVIVKMDKFMVEPGTVKARIAFYSEGGSGKKKRYRRKTMKRTKKNKRKTRKLKKRRKINSKF